MEKIILDGSNEEAENRLDEIINQLESENKVVNNNARHNNQNNQQQFGWREF